jgi:osmotically-inducible protein OsmY
MSNAKLLHARTFGLTLILAGALPGCATLGKCDSDSCRDDTSITHSIQSELAQHPSVEPNAISVQTRNHVVYLNGLVVSGLESDVAAAIAHDEPGVSRVVNSIVESNGA